MDSLGKEGGGFNLQEAVTKLIDSKYTPSDINTDLKSALQTLLGLKRAVTETAVQLKGGRKTDPEKWEKVKLFLYTLSFLTKVTPEFSKDLTLKSLLELFTNPEFKFPREYSNISQALINKIDAENGFNILPPSPTLTSNTESADKNGGKRKSITNETLISAKNSRENSISGSSNPPAQAPPNHPIYGENGIMRGLLWDGTNAKLNPETREIHKKDFHDFGHNNLKVGDCWPLQLAALRDGGHGCSQGGISGDKERGAYSVLISKDYDGYDSDQGDTVLYSAPGAKDSTTEEPDSSNPRIQSMRQSIVTGKPVRVFRNASCTWKDRPAMGIRYDGIYTVIENNVQTNGKGGKFWRFKLERLPDQVPIRTDKPTRQEMAEFEKVKDGY
ncbi:hypothetical protein SBOR_10165 [Sclerotinia borealis F-4128]|uniref:YDG domain-containing protein n=1 Tax=Sclerotinia borealis (strain F-4128) TaxID=1432307 RepID=W9C0K9_SCLBF|nr:hypothetical protein SBOR_10165 [Sclerotinia borealis F-4128]